MLEQHLPRRTDPLILKIEYRMRGDAFLKDDRT
jgi:hypothetical protein